MSVHKKLMEARLQMQDTELSKSGENLYAGYKYFTLADFLPEAQRIFKDVGLCGIVRFTAEVATLEIVDADNPQAERITITSPMGSANLKGCHEVQNIGAVESYQRRYLWMTAFEIVEDDPLDATTQKGGKKPERVTPNGGAWEAMSEEARAYLAKVAAECIQLFKANEIAQAVEKYETGHDPEERLALWSRFDSKMRSAMKKHKEATKEGK